MKHSTTHDEHVDHVETTHANVSKKSAMTDDEYTRMTKGSKGHQLIIGLVVISLILNIWTLVSLSSFKNMFFDMQIGRDNYDTFRKITENKVFKERQKEQFEMMLKQLETQATTPQGTTSAGEGQQPTVQVQQGTGK